MPGCAIRTTRRKASSPAHPDAANDLARLLLSAPRQPLLIIGDDAAQEIRLDRIPLLKGLDRRRLIVRHVRQQFPGTNFAACIASRRAADHEQLMLLDVSDDGPTAAWVRWRNALPNPPGGTVATTKLAATILWRLAGNDLAVWTHGFFLTESGLRQVTLQQGQPILTRLIPLPNATPEQLAAAIPQAVQAAQNYLARHGWREDQSEQVIGIVPPHLLSAARPQLPPAILLLSPAEVGRWLHYPQPVQDWFGLCALTARKFRRLLHPHFLPAEREALRHERLAQTGTALAVCLLIFSFAVLGTRLFDYRQLEARMRIAQTETKGIQQAAAVARQQMGDVGIARARLRQARLLQQDIQAPTPWPLLLALGHSMPEQIRMNSLRWEPQPQGGVTASLKLRVQSADGTKDAAQQEALQRYAAFTKALQEALPAAQLKTVQAPFSLGSRQTYIDANMLQTVAVGDASAELEIRLP